MTWSSGRQPRNAADAIWDSAPRLFALPPRQGVRGTGSHQPDVLSAPVRKSALALRRARAWRQAAEGSGACARSEHHRLLPRGSHAVPEDAQEQGRSPGPCHAQRSAEAAAWGRREGADGSGLKVGSPSLQVLRVSVSSSAAGPHLPAALPNPGAHAAESRVRRARPRSGGLASSSHCSGSQNLVARTVTGSPKGSPPRCLTAEGTESQPARAPGRVTRRVSAGPRRRPVSRPCSGSISHAMHVPATAKGGADTLLPCHKASW